MEEKSIEKIKSRFQKILSGTVFEEEKEVLGRILGLACEDALFEKRDE